MHILREGPDVRGHGRGHALTTVRTGLPSLLWVSSPKRDSAATDGTVPPALASYGTCGSLSLSTSWKPRPLSDQEAHVHPAAWPPLASADWAAAGHSCPLEKVLATGSLLLPLPGAGCVWSGGVGSSAEPDGRSRGWCWGHLTRAIPPGTWALPHQWSLAPQCPLETQKGPTCIAVKRLRAQVQAWPGSCGLLAVTPGKDPQAAQARQVHISQGEGRQQGLAPQHIKTA